MVVHNAAATFINATKDLPLFVIPETALKVFGQELPNLTSLATVLVNKTAQVCALHAC